MTLQEWEDRVSRELPAVQLIGEINLSSTELEDLRANVRWLVQEHGFRRATEAMRRRYPTAFVVYLVSEGKHHYDEGRYWPHVFANMSLTDLPRCHQEWGQAFEEITRRLHRGYAFPALRYVGAILGHAGIPDSGLPQFFEHMLQPAVTKPEWQGLSDSEICEEWTTRSPRYYVDQYTQRFLQNGGRVSEDFVSRCRDMADHWQRHGCVPAAESVGLSARTVASYAAWVRGLRVGEPSGPGRRLARPRICFDPFGLGVYVLLPAQSLEKSLHARAFEWRIRAGATDLCVQTVLQPGAEKPTTRRERVRLPAPVEVVSVTMEVGDTSVREWLLPLVSTGRPWCIFDAETGRLLDSRGSLPNNLVWMIASPGVHLDAAAAVERFPALPDAWHGWEATAIDLGQHRELRVECEDATVSIPVDVERALTPELSGGRMALGVDTTDAVYVGVPPSLVLPVASSDVGAGALAQWTLALRSTAQSAPERDLAVNIGTLARLLRAHHNRICVPLAAPDLLGPSPMGSYELVVRGHLGLSQQFHFAIVPHLAVHRQTPAIQQDADLSDGRARMVLSVPATCKLVADTDQPDVRVRHVEQTSSEQRYEITFGHDTDSASLVVSQVAAGRIVASVPFDLLNERVRWKLNVAASDGAAGEWLSSAVCLSYEELASATRPELRVEVPGVGVAYRRAALRVFSAPNALAFADSWRRLTVKERFCLLDLSPLRQALETLDAPSARADIVLLGIWDSELTVPAVIGQHGVPIERLDVSSDCDGENVIVNLAWAARTLLRKPVLRLWALCRPWSDCLSVPIRAELHENCRLKIPVADAPLGPYLGEIALDDQWVSPKRPHSEMPTVRRLDIGSAEDRLAQLSQAAAHDSDEKMTMLCERVLLYHLRGDAEQANAALRDCLQYVDAARSLETLAPVAELRRELPGNPLVQFLHNRLYGDGWLRWMIEARRSGAVDDRTFVDYLDHAPTTVYASGESCRRIVDVGGISGGRSAAESLLRRGDGWAIDAVVRWFARGDLGVHGACDLLRCNVEFALRELASRAADDTASQLLLGLLAAYPKETRDAIVQPGTWVRCQAGWGTVEAITERDSGKQVAFVHQEQVGLGYRLRVTVHPRYDPLPVTIDPTANTIMLDQHTRLYVCRKCDACMATSDSALYRGHELTAHDGIGASRAAIETDRLTQRTPLEFSTEPPAQEWA